MTLFTIDAQKCRKDGLCAAVCPRGLITVNVNETLPQPLEEAEELCIACGHCAAVCPHDALRLAALDSTDWPVSDPSRLPGRDQMHQLIRGRRSVRTYRDTPVDRARIESLIGLSRYAPTARNSQMLEWLVIDGTAELEALKGEVIAWMRAAVAQGDGASSYDFNTVLQAWDEGSDPILRGAPGLVVLHAPSSYPMGLIDSCIAATTFELAASAEGLGTCWAGYFMIAAKAWEPLRRRLALPEGNQLTAALMAGIPKYRYARLPERQAPRIQWR